MSWNNRIFKHEGKDGDSYALHETYYDEDTGEIETWTAEPVTEFSDSVDELIEYLEQQLADAKRFKDVVLDPKASCEKNSQRKYR